jgi:hypothetical protein
MWSSIKGAIFEADPAEATKAAPAPAGQAKPAITGAPIAISAGVNQDMVGAIKKVTLSRNSAYTRLLQAAEALADVIPDAVMRLKAAHKTGGAGATGQQIGAAVDIHLQDVDAEVGRFKASVEGKIKSEVGQLENEVQMAAAGITTANSQIEAARKRIIELEDAIRDLNAKGAAAQASALTTRAQYENAINEFTTAAATVRDELNASKAAILSTLK